jgi:hypothetical protein
MTKKYTLKPGNHQFAPGSHAFHHNDNLSDEEAEWYLEKYPHIAGLFVEPPEGCKVEISENADLKTSKIKSPKAPKGR